MQAKCSAHENGTVRESCRNFFTVHIACKASTSSQISVHSHAPSPSPPQRAASEQQGGTPAGRCNISLRGRKMHQQLRMHRHPQCKSALVSASMVMGVLPESRRPPIATQEPHDTANCPASAYISSTSSFCPAPSRTSSPTRMYWCASPAQDMAGIRRETGHVVLDQFHAPSSHGFLISSRSDQRHVRAGQYRVLADPMCRERRGIMRTLSEGRVRAQYILLEHELLEHCARLAIGSRAGVSCSPSVNGSGVGSPAPPVF